MSFWLPPLWFGREAGSAGATPVLKGINIGVPVQTRLIEVLGAEIANVTVWADVDYSESGDSIVVRSAGGESLTQANSWQQMYREFEIVVSSTTSDAAERLLDEVMVVIKRRRDAFNFVTADMMRGTYDLDSETFQRGLLARFRGRR